MPPLLAFIFGCLVGAAGGIFLLAAFMTSAKWNRWEEEEQREKYNKDCENRSDG